MKELIIAGALTFFVGVFLGAAGAFRFMHYDLLKALTP